MFPIVPTASSSDYEIDQFLYLMYRPLYWFGEGSTPQIDPQLSLADPPVYSNGDRTVVITLHRNYSWSDGGHVDAADLLFYIDELRAAIKLSAANWGGYTPGEFPDSVASAVVSSPYVLTLHLNRGYNPSFFTYNQLAQLVPIPSTFWDRTSPGGPRLAFTNPTDATLIYKYLAKASSSLSTFASNPLWQDVDGPFHLTSYDPATGGAILVPNAHYSG
ncbi:MAG: ABC transporter substrate-binding protein, partial [Acidimicrobiales bacterium]